MMSPNPTLSCTAQDICAFKQFCPAERGRVLLRLADRDIVGVFFLLSSVTNFLGRPLGRTGLTTGESLSIPTQTSCLAAEP
jgi:hypothetical protein